MTAASEPIMAELQYRLFRGVVNTIRFTPLPIASGLFRSLAGLGWALDGFHRRIANLQIRTTLPDKYSPLISLKVFINHADLLVDTIKYAHMSDHKLRRKIRVEGIENLEQALASQRGILLTTAHIGNWELLGHYPQLTGQECFVMAETRPNAALQRLVTEIREAGGIKMLPPRGGMLKTYIENLKEGKTAMIVTDLRGDRTCQLFCDVLGMPAPTNPAPAFMALKGDAIVLPISAIKRRGRYTFTIYEAIDSRDHLVEGEKLEHYRDYPKSKAVQSLSDAIQAWVSDTVRKNPDQWFWLYSRWTRRSNIRRVINRGEDLRGYIINQEKEARKLFASLD